MVSNFSPQINLCKSSKYFSSTFSIYRLYPLTSRKLNFVNVCLICVILVVEDGASGPQGSVVTSAVI